jgi:hypothetical protein
MSFIYTRQGKIYRYYTLSWVYLIGKLINFIFIGTVVAIVFFATEEDCNAYRSERACEERLGADYEHTLCIWDDTAGNGTQTKCIFNSYQGGVESTLIVTIIVNVFVAPIDALLKHFLLMTKSLLISREKGIRKDTMAAQKIKASAGAGAGVGTGAGTGTGAGEVPGAVAVAGTGADAGADAGTGIDKGTEAGARVDVGTGTGTGTGAGTEAEIGSEADAKADTDTDAKIGAGAGAGTEAGTGTGTGAGRGAMVVSKPVSRKLSKRSSGPVSFSVERKQLRVMVMVAVRHIKMQQCMDDLESPEELFLWRELLRMKERLILEDDIEKRQYMSNARSDPSSLVGDVPILRIDDKETIFYRIRRFLSFSSYGIEEAVRNKPAYMVRHQLGSMSTRNVIKHSEARYQLDLLNRTRKIQGVTISNMELFEDDANREVYLLKMFFVENMVGYRRVICERFFFPESLWGIRSGIYSSKKYQWFCTIIVPLYLLFFCFYVFLFGISIGQETTKVWLAAIIISFLEDTLLVEPLTILFYSIFVAGIVYKDVMVLANRMFTRQRTMLYRVKGQLDPIIASVQHFNAACRVARHFPGLYASRLLMSINDMDIPAAYLSRYDQKGMTNSLWKAVAMVKAVIILLFLTVLPEAWQEGFVEATASLFFNGTFFWMYISLDFTGNFLFLIFLC